MIVTDPDRVFELTVPVVVVGGGGCGLCAAIAARDGGADVLVLERDTAPSGSTGMSTGLIPAAGTPEQAAQGIADSPELFAQDILAKAAGADAAIVRRIAAGSADTVAWLQGRGIPLTLLEGFTYPGHSVRRMFGTPHRTGGELISGLIAAAQDAGATLVTGATVGTVFVDRERRVLGVGFRRADGAVEEVGCSALILACSGYGGNAQMVREHLPEIADAVYHGHPGNRGDALLWGRAMGAGTADMDAYQGHGQLAAGHGLCINWPTVAAGGFHLNLAGERFYDESCGYSAAAAIVVRQPQSLAWAIYDGRIAAILDQFEDYHDARGAGAIIEADDVATLAARTRLSEAALAAALAQVAAYKAGTAADPHGRDFAGSADLVPPYRAVRITGALFHTQGGLVVDENARVLDTRGDPLPNLFAGGGAARGISGSGSTGYLAGNGLVTATTLGKIAGRSAARQVTA